MLRVAIEGASGYSGMELTRLLARHPQVELVALTSSRWIGKTVREALGIPGRIGQLRYVDGYDGPADAVLLATPPEASRELAPRWLGRGARVVDLSNAYRGDANAVYGLTEHARSALTAAKLVANPGCYPTATALPMIPLLRAGLVADGPLIVDAKSGTTGAGRLVNDAFTFNELAQNHYPYRVANHQHVPEMERVLGRSVVFTPHLLPTRRGLLSAIYFRVAEGVRAEDLRGALETAYAGEPFVQVVEADEPLGLGRVAHTPNCLVAVAPGLKEGYGRAFGSLDNLLKGAASQAVQNLNRMLGMEETLGILP